MKIYHTETQSDYDALMIKLEAEGSMWHGEGKPTSWNGWSINSNETCVIIRGPRITQACLISCKNYYQKIPIIKYKAKAEDKMKFTKENVSKLFSEHDKYICFSINDLRDEILKLDDTPEKVVVPKFVADYLEERKRDGDRLVTSLYPFQDNFGELIEDWFEEEENNVSFARAWIDGYTIEKEPQYIVSIMDLGIDRIILMKNRLGHSFELESENDGHWEVHFTEQQIKEYDKRYWAFAIPVEGKK